MADAKLTGTITLGDSSAPTITQSITPTASNITSNGKNELKLTSAPTNLVILSDGPGGQIPTGKFFKFIYLKFTDGSGNPVQATIRINGATSLPVTTEWLNVVNAGTPTITDVDITSTATILTVLIIYAAD